MVFPIHSTHYRFYHSVSTGRAMTRMQTTHASFFRHDSASFVGLRRNVDDEDVDNGKWSTSISNTPTQARHQEESSDAREQRHERCGEDEGREDGSNDGSNNFDGDVWGSWAQLPPTHSHTDRLATSSDRSSIQVESKWSVVTPCVLSECPSSRAAI